MFAVYEQIFKVVDSSIVKTAYPSIDKIKLEIKRLKGGQKNLILTVIVDHKNNKLSPRLDRSNKLLYRLHILPNDINNQAIEEILTKAFEWYGLERLTDTNSNFLSYLFFVADECNSTLMQFKSDPALFRGLVDYHLAGNDVSRFYTKKRHHSISIIFNELSQKISPLNDDYNETSLCHLVSKRAYAILQTKCVEIYLSNYKLPEGADFFIFFSIVKDIKMRQLVSTHPMASCHMLTRILALLSSEETELLSKMPYFEILKLDKTYHIKSLLELFLERMDDARVLGIDVPQLKFKSATKLLEFEQSVTKRLDQKLLELQLNRELRGDNINPLHKRLFANRINFAFPQPILKNAATFTHLDTTLSLLTEGIEQNNCLADKKHLTGYIRSCMKGDFAIYRVVVNGERATVCINQSADDGWLLLDEFAGYKNDNLSKQMKTHILETLDNFNLNQPPANTTDTRYQIELSY